MRATSREDSREATTDAAADVAVAIPGWLRTSFQRLELLAAKLEVSRGFYLIWFALIYLPFACTDAASRLLWFDEFFTLYVSRLPHFSDIWSALAGGTEANPPLNYWLTRASYAVCGVNHLSSRLPAIAGFLVMSCCVFRFVARRCPAPYAAAAMAFPLLTEAYAYACEARPYGLVLGFAGLVLVCWQEAADGNRCRRLLWLAGLSLSVAAAIWSHYFGIFVVAPVAAAELFRSWTRKRIDLAVWLSLGLGIAPVMFLLPLIRSANANVFAQPLRSPVFWAKPGFTRMLASYATFLQPGVPILLFGGVIAALVAALRAADASESEPRPKPELIAHEIFAAVGFVGLPVLLTVFTELFTGCYVDRYALPAVLGCAILFGFGTAHVFRTRARGLLLAALLVTGFVVLRGWQKIEPLFETAFPSQRILDRGAQSGLPVAVANPLVFTRLSYYETPALTSRLVYLSEPSVATRYPDFIPELALLSLKKWAPMRVEDYRQFLAAHPHFYVYYTSMDRLEWLVPQLIKDGLTVRLQHQIGAELLFEVSAPHAVPIGGPTF